VEDLNITARIIDGKAIAARVRAEIAEGVQSFTREYGFAPGLTVVLVGDDAPSATYVRGKEKASKEVGIDGRVIHLPENSTEDKVFETVQSLNADESVHGILVQLPLPSHIDSDAITTSITPDKDVDGLHPQSLGYLMSGAPRFVPATPLGIQRILAEEGVELNGAEVVICGRGALIGRPLSVLLSQRGGGANATVTLCHTGTASLAEVTRRADVLVAAMGSAELIRGEMIKPGAVVIDAGTSRVDDPTRKRGYRLSGDVAFDEAVEVASAITPVPGGVGPLTIAMLLQNGLKAARLTIGGGH
jgi:methylenetetrahydrofolate dehydrogenase (NADP+)/methenyltetrahydrofolate cyclohydrolase